VAAAQQFRALTIAAEEADRGGRIAIAGRRQDSGELRLGLRAVDWITPEPIPPPRDGTIAHVLLPIASRATEMCIREALQRNARRPGSFVILQVDSPDIPKVQARGGAVAGFPLGPFFIA
jgi:hypothetical protein